MPIGLFSVNQSWIEQNQRKNHANHWVISKNAHRLLTHLLTCLEAIFPYVSRVPRVLDFSLFACSHYADRFSIMKEKKEKKEKKSFYWVHNRMRNE